MLNLDICRCGKPIHVMYYNDGVCEDCFADRHAQIPHGIPRRVALSAPNGEKLHRTTNSLRSDK